MNHRIPFRSACAGLFLALSSLVMPTTLAAADDNALNSGQIIERQLVGRVVDEDGKPLAGVEVYIPPAAGPLRGLPAAAPVVVTNDEGRFEVTVSSFRRLHLQYPYACPEGRVFQRKRVMKNGDGPLPELELVLPRAARVSGRVVDATGVPQAGVEVGSSCNGRGGGCVVDGAPPPCVHPEEYRSVSTDADGRYHFEALMPGWVEVSVNVGEKVLRLRRRTSAERELTDLDFVLPATAGALSGRVLTPSGEPLPGATVALSSGLERLTQATDANGSFRFEQVLSGKRFLEISHADHGWLEHSLELEPGSMEAEGLELKMPQGALVRGRVVVPEGFSLENVRLWFEDAASTETRIWGGSPSVTPLEDGSFQLVVPAGEHVLSARSWKDNSSARLPLTVTPDDTFLDVELRLPLPSRVVGSLVGLPSGENGRVVLRRGAPEDPVWGESKEGRFKFEGVMAGPWTLVAKDELGRAVERELEVGEAEVLDLGEVRFPPLSAVRGRVVGAAGQAGVESNLSFRQGELHRRVWTDEQGHFATQLSEGLWTAQAFSGAAGLALMRFEITDRDVKLPDLRLGPAPALRVRFVSLPPGSLVSYLRVTSPDGEESHLQPTDDGSFLITRVWPGEWKLETDVDGREVMEKVVVEGRMGAVNDVELTVAN